jgi:hypothetical protein
MENTLTDQSVIKITIAERERKTQLDEGPIGSREAGYKLGL